MKEPITGRDLFVISTLCTGFGVLLAWGLFYRWNSVPSVKDVDLSAWIQAFGTLIAIGIAIAVPHQVYSKERTERQSQNIRDRTERDERDRFETKAIAAEFLPIARKFRRELITMKANLQDEKYEQYSDAPRERLHLATQELKSWSAKVAKTRKTGEMALDAIVIAEHALSVLDDWNFYDNFTNDGICLDPNMEFYEKIPAPDDPRPIFHRCLVKINECIERMDSIFS